MRNTLPAVAALAVALCGQASAHAFLKTASPPVGSTIPQAPNQVVITFTEGVEPSFSTITVQDLDGARVDDDSVKLAGDDSHLAVGLKPLKPGSYAVTWHATSTDTHKTEGHYTFTIGQ